MAIESIASVKSHFESGDRPTQTEFENLIDTLGRATPLAIASAAEGGKTGVYEILGDGDVTARSTGTFGLQFLTVAGTASAHNALGISSAQTLFLASQSTASSRTLLGSGTVGDIIFQAVTTASAHDALGISPGTVGLTVLAAETTASAFSVLGVTVATTAAVSAQTAGAIPDASNMSAHPGVAKAWVNFDTAASIRASFNVSAVSDDSASQKTVKWIVPFAVPKYVVSIQQEGSGSDFNPNMMVVSQSVSAISFYHTNETLTTGYMVIAFGPQ